MLNNLHCFSNIKKVMKLRKVCVCRNLFLSICEKALLNLIMKFQICSKNLNHFQEWRFNQKMNIKKDIGKYSIFVNKR